MRVFFSDLSNTAVTSLPTAGLEQIETLKIEKTPSLKYIPSIYYFRVSAPTENDVSPK